MSVVLALDTATPAVTAGIVRLPDHAVLAERVTLDARAHAERLTPNVLAALADAALTMADLDAVVVGCGPGPFTGLRAGMATAAAYGHALGIPVHGVCSLDAIGVRTTGDVLVVTDARRREVYWARYRDGIRTDGPAVDAPADVDPGHRSGGRRLARARGVVRPAAVRARLPGAGRPGSRGVRLVGQPPAAGRALSAAARRQAPGGSPMTACSEPVTVGALTPADAERCAELEAQLFDGDDPWPAVAFNRELASKHNHYVAARVAGTLVGYAGISRLGRTPPFEYEVHTIGVDPAYQGRGIGRRLLDELLDFAGGGAVYLEVRTDNDAAIALYRSAGFAQIGLRRRYYRVSGADAYTMRREARP